MRMATAGEGGHARRSSIASSRTAAGVLLALLPLLLPGCGAPPDPNSSSKAPFIEAGDLPEIRERGTLRVLVPTLERRSFLPRRGSPLDSERELIGMFAEQEGLEPFWITVDSRSDLIPLLLDGHGDLVAANLTATPERREHVAFTVPVKRVREQVVTRRSDRTIERPEDLEGRRVAVRRSSSFRRTLERLRERLPDMEIEEVPENVDTDEILHRVATRRLDVTVADSNLVRSVLGYRDDLRVACDLTEDLPVGWAVRPSSPELLRRLNRFLSESQLARRRGAPHTGDLEQIREKRVLRLLTRNSASTYFLWRGELVGFEYELAREFALSENLRMDVIVPRRGEDLLTLLVEGQGDLVAAAMTPADERRRTDVAFSRPYNHVSQVVVAPVGESYLNGPEDLAHRTLYVRHSSAYWNTLSRLRASGVPLVLQAAPEHLETEEIIGLVAAEVYPLTVADSHVLDIELTWRDDVQAAFPLGDPVPLAWVVRASNPDLLQAVNAFLDAEYRGLTYNVLHRKYFESPKRIRRHIAYRTAGGRLSPYDEIVQRYAEEHGFDWRLIVAQIYEESGFDPTARSFAGAVGLLQVLPRTAGELGITDLEDPETNIRAGLRYLAWVRDRFEEDLPVRDRMWLTLAGYNVGPGHVRDARRLAARRGWNPDRWFDNVERAMLLLSRPEHARNAQHGYCRGSEPVHYVREIRSRYEAYLDMLSKERDAEVLAPRSL
jgi:membrane-bound lytic murein transglycosylase F